MTKRHDDRQPPPMSIRVHMPPELHRALRHLAVDRGVPVAALIAQACADLASQQP